jgi:4-hydroxy 2-oxovalerate aldolase
MYQGNKKLRQRSKIQILDCTLRDGGYINDWQFGEDGIKNITMLLKDSQIDIIELGFLRNENIQNNRAVFNSTKGIVPDEIRYNKTTQFAVMIEATINPFPLELLENHNSHSVDIIRAMVWKRLLHEGFDYCKALVEKGYKVCIQPVRFDQYTEDDFVEAIKLFNTIHPMAFYIVDSFGANNKKTIMHYLELADSFLDRDIALGFHGHNNLLQVYGVAESFVEHGFKRDIIIDSSVYGMGRGAGNLNTELIVKYLNESCNKDYKIEPLNKIFQHHLKQIYEVTPWGYSIPYYITALHHANPLYATYYGNDVGLDSLAINEILQTVSDEDKIHFIKENADRYADEYQKGGI